MLMIYSVYVLQYYIAVLDCSILEQYCSILDIGLSSDLHLCNVSTIELSVNRFLVTRFSTYEKFAVFISKLNDKWFLEFWACFLQENIILTSWRPFQWNQSELPKYVIVENGLRSRYQTQVYEFEFVWQVLQEN